MSVILAFLTLLVVFYILARICELHFVPSLEIMGERMKLSSDVAGATLMAIGSSAPELFTSLISVLRPGDHASLGAGTIVGSAIFNLLVIVGASLMYRTVKLSWQPAVRDLLFYAGSIIMVFIVFADGRVVPLEALFFVGYYVVYLFSFHLWKKAFPYEIVDNGIDATLFPEVTHLKKKKHIHIYIQEALDSVFVKLFPRVHPENPKSHSYIVVFFLSIVYIVALSWAMVELGIYLAYHLGIPEALIGIVILAGGTSIQDLISSMIVSRNGKADMAVANAVGSNVFDIQIGLGLPWLIFFLVFGAEAIVVDTGNLSSSVLLLLGSVILLMSLLVSFRWKLGKKTGYFLMGCYVLYVIIRYIGVN